MKKMQSLLPHMVRLVLVLTLGTLITSCSQVHPKAKLECYSPLAVVCDLEIKAKASEFLTSQTISPVILGSILP